MNKRTSVVTLSLLILAAVVFGFILVNKGDGPVMGMIISDKAIVDNKDYKDRESSPSQGGYLVAALEFNKLNDKFIDKIPEGRDLYFNIHVVECPKGSQFTVKWLLNGENIKEDTNVLSTDKSGIISYLLEGTLVKKGNYSFEVYYEGRKVLEKGFQIE